MRLIKPSFEILNITPNPLQVIELAGRTCYKSESKISAVPCAAGLLQPAPRRGYMTAVGSTFLF